MPSLHAAFPVLSVQYLRERFGRWRLPMLGYAASAWFAVVYMAEHWISDVAAGVVRAVLAYMLVESMPAAWVARTRRCAAPEAVAVAMSAVNHKVGPGR